MRIHRFTALALISALLLTTPYLSVWAQEAETVSAPIALNYDNWAVLINPSSGEELTRREDYRIISPLGGVNSNSDPDLSAATIQTGAYTLFSAIPANENSDMQYALMDQTGKLLTENVYDMISALDEDHLLFMQNGLMGVMDLNGQVILEAEYTHLISNGAGGYLALRTDPYNEEPDGVYYIDENGHENATGVKVSYPFYSFSEGLCAAASSDGKYGYLGTDGRWAIPPQFTFAGDFVSGGAVTSLSSGIGVIDSSGNWVITPKYKWIDRAETVMLAAQGNTMNLMKNDGTLLSTYSVTDETGSYLCNDQYAVIATEDKSLLVDAATGKSLLAQSAGTMYNVWDMPSDRIIVNGGEYSEKCVYLYSTSGEKISGPYQELVPAGTNNGIDCFAFAEFTVSPSEDGSYMVMDEQSYHMGIVDRDGKLLLPADYKLLYQIKDNRFWAETDSHVGVIDLNGEWIVQYAHENSAGQADD